MVLPFLALYVKELGGSYTEFAFVLSASGFLNRFSCLSVIPQKVFYTTKKI